MSWNEKSDNATGPVLEKHQSLSWRELIIRILGGYVIYGLALYYVDPSAMMTIHGSLVKTVVGNAFQILLLFSVYLVPTSVIALIIAKVLPRNYNKPVTLFLHRALIVALLVSAVGLYFTSVARNPPFKNEKAISSNTPAGSEPIVAAITIQAANGLTVQNFDQAWLKHAESWVVDMLTTQARNAAKERRNGADINPKSEAESMYMVIQGKKLAINKIGLFLMGETSRFVAIWGLEGENLIRVTCYRVNNDEISILSGECGNKIKEAFGVSARP